VLVNDVSVLVKLRVFVLLVMITLWSKERKSQEDG